MNLHVSAPAPTPTSTPASSHPPPASNQFPQFRFGLSIGKSSFNFF